LIVPAIGIVTAVIGIFLTKLRSTDKSAMSAINRSFFLSAVISAGLTGLATFTYLPAKFDQLTNFSPKVLEDAGNINPRVLAFGAVLIQSLINSQTSLQRFWKMPAISTHAFLHSAQY